MTTATREACFQSPWTYCQQVRCLVTWGHRVGNGSPATRLILFEVADPRRTSVIAGSRLDLLDALERLEAHRPELVAPLVLRDLCQPDYHDIAEQLEIPVGTLKSRIHHARKHVRDSLQRG